MEETKNSKNFFKRLQYSIFKVEKYNEFLEESPKIAISYILKLILIVAVVITAINIVEFVLMANKGADFIRNDLNDFLLEDNTLYFSSMQEAYDEEYDVYFIADTSEISEETLTNYKNKAYDSEYSIILLNNKCLIGLGGDITEYTYEDICENLGITELNKTTITNLLDEGAIYKLAITLFFVTGISIYITQIFAVTMNVLFLFIFAYFTKRIIRVPLKISSIFNISAYSISLSTVINLIYSVVYKFTQFEIPYFDIMYLLIAYIYIIAAMLIIKSDLIKIKGEVQKIEEVQKDVAKEIKEKEEEENKEKDKENKDTSKEEKSDSKKEDDDSNTEDGKEENAEPDGSEI
jgi:hypothetical protein